MFIHKHLNKLVFSEDYRAGLRPSFELSAPRERDKFKSKNSNLTHRSRRSFICVKRGTGLMENVGGKL